MEVFQWAFAFLSFCREVFGSQFNSLVIYHSDSQLSLMCSHRPVELSSSTSCHVPDMFILFDFEMNVDAERNQDKRT